MEKLSLISGPRYAKDWLLISKGADMAKKPKGRPEKKNSSDLLIEIEQLISEKHYSFTNHAQYRSKTRLNVSDLEVLTILKGRSKFHESKKDSFNEDYQAWNYSIRGKSIDAEDIRIIVSFDENNLLIITVINLDE